MTLLHCFMCKSLNILVDQLLLHVPAIISTKVSIDSAIMCHFRCPHISWSCATVSVSDTEISFHCLPTRIHTSVTVKPGKNWHNCDPLSHATDLQQLPCKFTTRSPMASGRIGAIVHPVAQKSGENAAETSPDAAIAWRVEIILWNEGSDFESRPGLFKVQVVHVCVHGEWALYIAICIICILTRVYVHASTNEKYTRYRYKIIQLYVYTKNTCANTSINT